MNNIILIGFMGSGKTTMGHWIMENVHMDFVDTDQYIEQQQRRKISEIFADEGEEYFRDLETKVLQELTKRHDTVISVGGGLPVRACNRRLMREIGVVIYLRTGRQALIKRLQTDTTRPLLAGGDLEGKIDSLMAARKDLYMDAADIVIDTDDKSCDKIYNEIENKILEYKDGIRR